MEFSPIGVIVLSDVIGICTLVWISVMCSTVPTTRGLVSLKGVEEERVFASYEIMVPERDRQHPRDDVKIAEFGLVIFKMSCRRVACVSSFLLRG